mmetsp:Transcript_4623/g.7414  ORF Transcript_4623/g.7414 Transcript_4623/m.7414 type:complete len:202 (+) Transcript_4623:183-788(+)
MTRTATMATIPTSSELNRSPFISLRKPVCHIAARRPPRPDAGSMASSPGVVHAGPRTCRRRRCQLPFTWAGSSSVSALVKRPTKSRRMISASSTGMPPHASASAFAGSCAMRRCAIAAARASNSEPSPPHSFQSRSNPRVLAMAARLVGKLMRPSGVGTPARSRSISTSGSPASRPCRPSGGAPGAVALAPARSKKKTTSQ